jgi:hypothetical protein
MRWLTEERASFEFDQSKWHKDALCSALIPQSPLKIGPYLRVLVRSRAGGRVDSPRFGRRIRSSNQVSQLASRFSCAFLWSTRIPSNPLAFPWVHSRFTQVLRHIYYLICPKKLLFLPWQPSAKKFQLSKY